MKESIAKADAAVQQELKNLETVKYSRKHDCIPSVTGRKEVAYEQQSFRRVTKQPGWDVTAGYKAVELMKERAARTKIPGAISSIGGLRRPI